MKRIGILYLLLTFYSCDYFDKKKVDADDLLNEELKTFNWNEVDSYPTFESCKSATSKAEGKQCFENTLIKHIQTALGETVLVSSQAISDTIFVAFKITDQGEITTDTIKTSSIIEQQFPTLDSLILKSLKALPKVYPAVKRGQKVKTQFKLPIVVKTN